MTDHRIQVRTWVRASDAHTRSGLLGWISVAYGALLIDNITLRKTAHGRLALSFPTRRARSGKEQDVVRPVDREARNAIEREILRQLGQREDAHGHVQP